MSCLLRQASPLRKANSLQSPTRPPFKLYSTDATRSVGRVNPSLENATVAHVGELLASSRRKVENSDTLLYRRQELAAGEQSGSKMLPWLQQLQGLDEEHVVAKQFCVDLAWLLVVEGKADLLANWVLEEGAALKPHLPRTITREVYRGDNRLGRCIRRRHDLVSALANAHLTLSSDGTANDALRYFRAIKAATKGRGLQRTIPWAGLATCIDKHLERCTSPPCDAGLFDGFCNSLGQTMPPELAIQTSAFLQLYHPVSPNPWPALSLLKYKLDVIPIDRMKSSAVNYWGHNLMRTCYLLRLRGAAEQAQWAEIVLRDKFKNVWHISDAAFRGFEQDPKLYHLLDQQRGRVEEQPRYDNTQILSIPPGSSKRGSQADGDDVVSDLLAVRSQRRR